MNQPKLSRGRVLTLVITAILGILWFFMPSASITDPPANSAPVPTSTPEQLAPQPSAPVKNSSLPDTSARKSASSQSDTVNQSVPGEDALNQLQEESTRRWVARRSGMKNDVRTLARGLWTSGNAADYRTSADSFVKRYAEGLLGVPIEQLKFEQEEITDRTKIVYSQVLNGVPVYGGSLTLFFENGGLTRVQNDLVSGAEPPVRAEPEQTADQVFAAWNQGAGSHYEMLSSRPPKVVLYPGSNALVYDFVVRDLEDRKTYRILYDTEARQTIKKFPTQVR